MEFKQNRIFTYSKKKVCKELFSTEISYNYAHSEEFESQ